jgi:hypothetical protein
MSIINDMAISCEHGNDYSPFINGENHLDQSVTLNLPMCALLHGILAKYVIPHNKLSCHD